ncbi:glutaredoxin domain-containing protein [Streptomyces sp. 7N604]|uniref:glutaredoxin domain-containing protein n=1 Tax=Streptomyces sp. 7N604 TaxID=3457415 RepID=UPI003FD27480
MYWRPGCPYCALLRRGLRRAGLPYYAIDIYLARPAGRSIRTLGGRRKRDGTYRDRRGRGVGQPLGAAGPGRGRPGDTGSAARSAEQSRSLWHWFRRG